MNKSTILTVISTIVLIILNVTPFHSATKGKLPKADHEAHKDLMHMISFNAWALPVWIPKSEQIKRYKEIPFKLIEQNADIICIQEAFARKFRKKLLPALEEFYHTESDFYCNKNIVGPVNKDCHGGLITFSKYPILSESFYPYPVYDKMRIEEQIGEKGFLLTTIRTPNGIINVINTHLYAGLKDVDEKHRMVQIHHMDSILNTLSYSDLYPTFLLGDLNVRHPEVAVETSEQLSSVYEYITDDMGFTDPALHLSQDYYTIDRSRNAYSGNNNGKQKLDYCLYRQAGGHKISCKDQGILFDGMNAISDHLAWSSTYALSADDRFSTVSTIQQEIQETEVATFDK